MYKDITAFAVDRKHDLQHNLGRRLKDFGVGVVKDLFDKQFPGDKVAYGAGCDECFHSGYAGRTAIYEIMPIDPPVQEQIVNKDSASAIKKGAISRGLRTLRMDGIDKLLAGETTPSEIVRVTQRDVF